MKDSEEEFDMVGDRVKVRRRGKKGTYVAEFHHAGQHRKVSLKTSNLKVARERALKIAAQLTAGEYQTAPPALTVEQAVEDYLTARTADRVAKGTLDRYSTVLRNFLAFLLSVRVLRLSQVTLPHLDKYRESRFESKHPRTVDHETKIVRFFFRWCHTRLLVRENSLASVRYPRWPAEKHGGPSLAEVNLILTVADGNLRVLLAVLAFTGLRSGELRRLRREDVDLVGGWIQVVSRPGGETKTRMSRKIPIHPRLRSYLEAYRSPPGPWAFADHRAQGTADPVNQHALNKAFRAILTKVGYPAGRPHGWVVHSFRHFFETHMVNAGVSQWVTDAWMGHQSDRAMGVTYFQLRDEESQRRMNLVPFGTELPAGHAGKEV